MCSKLYPVIICFLLLILRMQNTYNILTLNINNIQSNEKFRILSRTLNTLDIDIALLQEVNSPNIHNVYGYNAEVNTDYTTRGTAILLKQNITYDDVKMTSDCRGISVVVENVTIVNVYGPSGANKRTERNKFFSDDIAALLNNARNIVMGGDFNAIISPKDHTGHYEICTALKHTITKLQLRDSWEAIHKNRILYTYRRHNTAGRLDRIYVNKDIEIRRVDICPTELSDHCGFITSLRLHLNTQPYGRGFWKLNSTYLNEETQEQFRLKWDIWRRQQRHYPTKLNWWIVTKNKIKNWFKTLAREKQQLKHQYKNFLYAVLRDLYKQEDVNKEQSNKIREIKAKITKIQLEDLRGTTVRAKIANMQDETPSVFQIIKERKREKRKYINKIKDNNGNVVTTQTTIKQVFENFFYQLYSTAQKDTEQQRENNPQTAYIELFNMDEITSALQRCPKNKSPGEDGLTVEFYLKFWDIIKNELKYIITKILTLDSIPTTFTSGITLMIPKIVKPQTVEDYRPITLLNGDYKLLMRCIKQRLHPEVESAICATQQCVRSQGNILNALCAIRDAISDAHHPRANKILLSLDFDHAFDRVNHQYLFETMQKIGIDTSYIRLLQKIMEHATTKIQINGYFTKTIPITRSVRQGCPLSMHLFVISLEPLLRSLQNYIKSNPKNLVRAFADDISIVLTQNASLPDIHKIITTYCSASGAILNVKKTKAIIIGQSNIQIPNWIKIHNTIKILGITFAPTLTETIHQNWNRIINNVRQVLSDNRFRTLHLIQRIQYVNMYALSKVWYTSQVLPLPKLYGIKLRSVTGWYIWTGHIFRVNRDQLTLPKTRGGLNAIDPQMKSDSLFLKTNWKHLKELGDPYSHTFLSKWLPEERTKNPPDLRRIPAQAPQIKKLLECISYSRLPQMADVLTTKNIYQEKVSQLPNPLIMRQNPTHNWKRIWRNLHNKYLPPHHKNVWYQFINGIIPTAELLHQRNMKTTPLCEKCGNIDTLQHRFEQCTMSPIWRNNKEMIIQSLNIQDKSFGFQSVQWPNFKFIPVKNDAVIVHLGQIIWTILQ